MSLVQPHREGHLRRRRVRRAAPGGEEQGQEGHQGARKGLAWVRSIKESTGCFRVRVHFDTPLNS